jgi:hypothetical protein
MYNKKVSANPAMFILLQVQVLCARSLCNQTKRTVAGKEK